MMLLNYALPAFGGGVLCDKVLAAVHGHNEGILIKAVLHGAVQSSQGLVGVSS